MEVEFVEDTLLEEILLEEDKVCDDEVSVVASDDVCAGPSWCFIVIMALLSEVEAANCVLRTEVDEVILETVVVAPWSIGNTANILLPSGFCI